LTPTFVAKLTDLGLARQTDDKEAALSEAGKAYGTPYYISPEQIRGDMDIDFRADIYSLGATMYHLVTGRPPFEGETPSAVMHKHLKDALIPADHVNTELSSGIGEIIDVAMAKRREERYASTEELLEDLRAVRNRQPPIHTRRAMDLDRLAQIESTGQAMDTVPAPVPEVKPWQTPLVKILIWAVAASLFINLILVIILSHSR
jgi:serine/threonine protein kinase